MIVFELLLDVDGTLLEIGNGQVNAADFMVVCEYHPQITEVVLSLVRSSLFWIILIVAVHLSGKVE